MNKKNLDKLKEILFKIDPYYFEKIKKLKINKDKTVYENLLLLIYNGNKNNEKIIRAYSNYLNEEILNDKSNFEELDLIMKNNLSLFSLKEKIEHVKKMDENHVGLTNKNFLFILHIIGNKKIKGLLSKLNLKFWKKQEIEYLDDFYSEDINLVNYIANSSKNGVTSKEKEEKINYYVNIIRNYLENCCVLKFKEEKNYENYIGIRTLCEIFEKVNIENFINGLENIESKLEKREIEKLFKINLCNNEKVFETANEYPYVEVFRNTKAVNLEIQEKDANEIMLLASEGIVAILNKYYREKQEKENFKILPDETEFLENKMQEYIENIKYNNTDLIRVVDLKYFKGIYDFREETVRDYLNQITRELMLRREFKKIDNNEEINNHKKPFKKKI